MLECPVFLGLAFKLGLFIMNMITACFSHKGTMLWRTFRIDVYSGKVRINASYYKLSISLYEVLEDNSVYYPIFLIL